MSVLNKSIDTPEFSILPGGRILAAVCLVFFAPVLLAVAVLIKCESPGPALVKRNRRGANGGTVAVLEFRTVAASGAISTPLGAFLRVSRLEALPRFLSMLRGELSIKAMIDMMNSEI